MTPVTFLCLLLSLTHQVTSHPVDPPLGLVIPPATSTSLSPPITKITTTEARDPSEIQAPQITRFHVDSRIQFRYARTVMESHVKNPDIAPQLATFAVVIPESAFISNFSMVLNGREFVARVEEKEKAKETFDEAVTNGLGAGLVSQDVRDSNRFIISANVESGHKIIFKLTYDQLLERKDGLYEQEINIDLKQIVEDFKIEVHINESLPITTINVPELLQSNEIDFEDETENKIAVVERNINGDDNNAKIVFAPNKEQQEAAKEQGESEKLVIRYDVDRRGQDSEVQVIDGYFVHYFVPDNLETLPKHAIFILDTSGSMSGEKIQQLKDSMFTVLEDLKPTDFFNIITFSSNVIHWTNSEADDSNLEVGVDAVSATKENTKAAIKYVLDLEATGGTDINSAILAGLELFQNVTVKETLPQDVASMIVFLSDGEATEGETNSDTIKTNIAKANSEYKLPIFSVAFGLGADFQLLKDISQNTDSHAKRVYEGSDAALQLENFYSEISSPLVTNLKFNYVGELVDNSSVSDTKTKTFFKGGQFVVVGKLEDVEDGELEVEITGDTSQGAYSRTIQICLRKPIQSNLSELTISSVFPHRCIFPSPVPKRSQAQEFMQSLHAFLNIKQLLRKDEKEAALALSLENNFVTPVTSLVVVRPGEKDILVSGSKPEFNHNRLPTVHNLRVALSSCCAYNKAPFASTANQVQGLRRRITSRTRRPNIRGSLTTTFPFLSFTSTTTVPLLLNTTGTVPSSCSGNLTVYSRTYHRGENLTLLTDSNNLSVSNFDDKAVSATVEGSCCWILFSDPDYRGDSYRLVPGGDYKTTSSFGRSLLQEVSSVRRIIC